MTLKFKMRPDWKELQDAVGKADLAAVRALLADGACPFEKGHDREHCMPLGLNGYSALERASMLGYAPVVEALMNEGLVTFAYHLKRGYSISKEPLPDHSAAYAAQEAHTGILKLLKEAGADLNAQAPNSRWGNTLLIDALYEDKYKTPDQGSSVQALIDAGADPNAPDIKGHTPLSIAVISLFMPSIRQLLAAGADINATTSRGNVTENLLLTGFLKANSFACLELLYEHGGKRLPYSDIGRQGALGVPVAFRMIQEDKSLMLEFILEKNWLDPNTTLPLSWGMNQKGTSLLDYATIHQLPHIAALLLEYGADLFQPTPDPLYPLPLFRAVHRGELLLSNGTPELFHALVDRGADLHGEFRGERFYNRLDTSWRVYVDTLRMLLKEEMTDAVAQGTLLPKLVSEGKPTPMLLRACAHDLLPELASPFLWEGKLQEGKALLGAVRNALPPYWKTKLEAIDLTPFEREAVGNFQLRVQKPVLNPGQRR